MTKYEQYNQYCIEHKNDDTAPFFKGLQELLNCSYGTAMNIWYAEQRSWFEQEMVDELIRLDGHEINNGEFYPNLFSGEFDWDYKNKKFIPENDEKMEKMEILIDKVENKLKENGNE